MSDFKHMYAAAVQLAVPFVEKALRSDGKVPTGPIAEQAVELAIAIRHAVEKVVKNPPDGRSATSHREK